MALGVSYNHYFNRGIYRHGHKDNLRNAQSLQVAIDALQTILDRVYQIYMDRRAFLRTHHHVRK